MAFVEYLISHLIHLERSGNGLDQDGTTNGATAHADVVLSKVEGIVPQPGLEMRLHLGQIEVWAKAAFHKLMCIVEKVQTEVEQTTGDRFAINSEVLLLEMPPTGTGDECGECAVGAELVFLLALLEVDLSADGVVEVGLAVDHVVPCRCAGVWYSLVSCQIEDMIIIYPQNQPYMSRH